MNHKDTKITKDGDADEEWMRSASSSPIGFLPSCPLCLCGSKFSAEGQPKHAGGGGELADAIGKSEMNHKDTKITKDGDADEEWQRSASFSQHQPGRRAPQWL